MGYGATFYSNDMEKMTELVKSCALGEEPEDCEDSEDEEAANARLRITHFTIEKGY